MEDNDVRRVIGAYDESGLNKLFKSIGAHPDVAKEKIEKLKTSGFVTCGFSMCAMIQIRKEILNSEYDLEKYKD